MKHEITIQPPARRLDELPALLPALGLLTGTCAAPQLSYLPMPAVALLLALGLALARRAGVAVAALALGLLQPALHPAREPAAVDPRPVELVARVASHPIRHDDGTFFHARVELWRRAAEVAPAAFDLQVTVPPDMAAPAIGSTVRLRGYLRRSVGFANTGSGGPGPWRLRLKSAHFLTLEEPPGRLAALAGWVRRRAEAALESAGARRGGPALVRALVLGDSTRLPKTWRQALRRCGLAHLLAVSGLHVGLLAVLLLLPAAALPPGLRYWPALAGLAVYLLLVGPQPAVLRASLMGLLALGALGLHRPPGGLNALAGCVAVLLLLDPGIVQRLGFQLTVAATAGILLLAPCFTRRWTALPAAVRQPLAVTAAAQLATLPWTVPLAGGVHPAAPLLNLLAIPYLAGCLLLSFLWLTLASLASTAALALAPALDLMAAPVAALAELPPGPAFFSPLRVPPAAVPWITLSAILAGLRPRFAARCGLILCLLVQAGGRRETAADPELVALDVGQGDAILLRDGPDAVLVDGGGWPHGDLGGRLLAPALAALGVRTLRAVVLTHPDGDHCGGLVDLVRYLPVAEIWMGPGWVGGTCAAELLASPVRRWRVLWQGEAERFGRWRLQVLHPAAGERRGANDRSLVLMAAVAGHRVLLTGDVEGTAERQLVARWGRDLGAGVLKVAHHGSRTSTTEALLKAVRPRIALISAGPANPYGHPSREVLDRLRAAGTTVLRTDRSGMIRLRLAPSGKVGIDLPFAPRWGRAP